MSDNRKMNQPARLKTPRRLALKVTLSGLLVSALLMPTLAQSPFDDERSFRRRPTLVRPEATGPSFGEFTFVRTIYDSPYGDGYRRPRYRWNTDFPEADNN